MNDTGKTKWPNTIGVAACPDAVPCAFGQPAQTCIFVVVPTNECDTGAPEVRRSALHGVHPRSPVAGRSCFQQLEVWNRPLQSKCDFLRSFL